MDKYIGRLLDNRYEILEVLGTGGMAVVYKARCHRLNRLVAIKILKDDYLEDEEFRRRFHSESQAVAMFSHPNIVSVYDVSTSLTADYIVMELIEGITLKQYMEKKGVLNWKETLHFAIQIAKALEHAHSRGIVHRDIKPQNIMVLRDGTVKVTDFGIARMMSKGNTLTKEALGSVHYISPEQAKGGHIDNRSDLYSLGVVMYEMSTGRPPYDGETPVSVAIQHINGKAPMPSMLNPNLPGGLEQIIIRAMSTDPADRYPSAAALLTDLDEFRKNPAILFDYNNPDTDMDAATRMQPPKREIKDTQPMPKPVAERTAAQSNPRPRPTNPTPAQKPQRRKEVIMEDREEMGKAGTIAIIACASVAVIAIVLLCIALFGGNVLGSSDELVNAPNLIGSVYDENMDYGDVVVEISNKQYSDEYPKGQIMEQNPKANKKMAKGDTIRVVISLGRQPKEKVMVDLSHVPQNQAEKFLNAMELNLQFLPKMESSSTIEAGCVIRTNPIEGEPLENGQTVIMWISTGPQTVVADLPKVETYSQQVAEHMLNEAGFQNIVVTEVESEEPKGTVLVQYPSGGLKLDVNTTIELTISRGNEEDTTLPGDEQDNSVELMIPVQFDEPLEEDAVLTIWKDNELVAQRTVYAGTFSVDVKLRGEGVVTFTAKLENASTQSWNFRVDFGDDDLGV